MPKHNRKSDVDYIVDSETGCWVWQRGTAKGYGVLQIKRRNVYAHRFYYERVNGAIPVGFTIDHLCRNPLCVNPDHLEAVTMTENLRRGNGFSGLNAQKTHCPQGHPYTEENTYISRRKDGTFLRRVCKTCHLQRSKERYERLRARKVRGME